MFLKLPGDLFSLVHADGLMLKSEEILKELLKICNKLMKRHNFNNHPILNKLIGLR